MATTDTELKKLNKTVDEAVNMLKIYMGNSAQVKGMNEKQREAISKWFDVGEQAEETQKKQRAFVERERDENGKFLKKKEDQASKFMGIAKSVGGILGKAGTGLKTAAVGLFKGLKENLSSFFGQIKSHFLGLFGEESELFGLIGSLYDTVKGFFGWFARGFIFIFKKSPAWANKMLKTLNNMYGLQISQMKTDFLEAKGTKKKGGIWGILATILVGIAAGVGAWLHRKLFLLSRLPIFAKITKMFSKIDDIPFIGRLFKGVKFGFKWLGWPLTLLLSIIDFIKGFAATQGSLFEKVKGGWWTAFKEFIELPVQFIGWIIEKAASGLGIEVQNISDKIMSWVHVLTDYFNDLNPFGMLFDFIDGFVGTEGTFWQKIKGGFADISAGLTKRFQKWHMSMMQAIQPIIAGVINFFADFWNKAVEWISSVIPKWLPKKYKKSLLGGLQSMKVERIEAIKPTGAKSPLDMANEYEKQRIQAKQKGNKDLEDKIEKGTKATEKANKTNEGTINAVTTLANNQKTATGGTDTQQIPDELDNWIMDVKNYGGDFD